MCTRSNDSACMTARNRRVTDVFDVYSGLIFLLIEMQALQQGSKPGIGAKACPHRIDFDKHQQHLAHLVSSLQEFKCFVFVTEATVNLRQKQRRSGFLPGVRIEQFESLAPVSLPSRRCVSLPQPCYGCTG